MHTASQSRYAGDARKRKRPVASPGMSRATAALVSVASSSASRLSVPTPVKAASAAASAASAAAPPAPTPTPVKAASAAAAAVAAFEALPPAPTPAKASAAAPASPAALDHNNYDCATCGRPGEVVCCDRCPNVFHMACIGAAHPPLPADESAPWYCCSRPSSSASAASAAAPSAAAAAASAPARAPASAPAAATAVATGPAAARFAIPHGKAFLATEVRLASAAPSTAAAAAEESFEAEVAVDGVVTQLRVRVVQKAATGYRFLTSELRDGAWQLTCMADGCNSIAVTLRDAGVCDITRMFIAGEMRRRGCGTRALAFIVFWLHLRQGEYARALRVASPSGAGKSWYTCRGFSKDAVGDLALAPAVSLQAGAGGAWTVAAGSAAGQGGRPSRRKRKDFRGRG